MNVAPVSSVNFAVSTGTVVPETVVLHEVPETVVRVHPAWRGYKFIVVKDEIVIIEPKTRKIVTVIEKR